MYYSKHLSKIFSQFNESFESHLGMFTFYISSALIGVGLFKLSIDIDKLQSNILTSISIYAGFLVGMLIPFLNFIEIQENYIAKKKENIDDDERKFLEDKKRRIEQYRIMYTQVSFALLASILGTALVFIAPSLTAFLSGKLTTIYGVTVNLGNHLACLLSFSVYFVLSLNLILLGLILISSNVIIYPQLKKMT